MPIKKRTLYAGILLMLSFTLILALSGCGLFGGPPNLVGTWNVKLINNDTINNTFKEGEVVCFTSTGLTNLSSQGWVGKTYESHYSLSPKQSEGYFLTLESDEDPIPIGYYLNSVDSKTIKVTIGPEVSSEAAAFELVKVSSTPQTLGTDTGQ